MTIISRPSDRRDGTALCLSGDATRWEYFDSAVLTFREQPANVLDGKWLLCHRHVAITESSQVSHCARKQWNSNFPSTLYRAKVIIVPHRIIWTYCTGRWWVGCYIWYSEEGTGMGRSPPRLLLDTIPACDGQIDRQTDMLPQHNPHYA